LTEEAHWQLLRDALKERPGQAPCRPRDPSWQHAQRQRDLLIRAETVAVVDSFAGQDLSATQAAQLVGVPPRTLRQWRHDLSRSSGVVKVLGRPHTRCTAEQAEQVMTFLHGHGPRVGVPTLRGQLPAAPRAELRDLLRVFRHLWAGLHPRECHVLHWLRAGAVWAMDFHEPRQRIDGLYPYVLAVRDLASGMQLAWTPVSDATATSVLRELAVLFTIHGAPLVLKSDNGSAFRADALQRYLRFWQVWPLYSPPGRPGYNGAIEAAIGSLKTRTGFEAYRHGHAGTWTGADLDAARELANSSARPRGPKGPTPVEVWEARRPPPRSEHQAFSSLVREREALVRGQDCIALDAALDHYQQADLHRKVLTQALVESGLLTIKRRRIPQRFFGQKVAKIW
jgi:transposase InsO family protein